MSGRTRSNASLELERGGSPLLDRSLVDATYGALEPMARACVRFGISANSVTWSSLVLAVVAGGLVATGHFGLAAATLALSALGDGLDGLVARGSGTAGRRGELFDATAARYSEMAFLAGLAVHYRTEIWTLILALLAISASTMTNYASAKAEALGVPVPRGIMRRPERVAYLTMGALLVPFATALLGFARLRLPSTVMEISMLAALAIVAGVGNVSAIRRLAAIARSVTAPSRCITPELRLSAARKVDR
ncbi:CDP-alcohol phosphatidyltransferase family protein [Labilithrix luteola]|uniref:CDP-alcohol phosphatidyltransferase family protein n=1 Tax=Labilithrix luteola TaxID=1391654 RepID=UPI0014732BE3|nr:CDP-alcohol phosphatidyltransferase family protein [Labilithrix luteola]